MENNCDYEKGVFVERIKDFALDLYGLKCSQMRYIMNMIVINESVKKNYQIVENHKIKKFNRNIFMKYLVNTRK